MACCPSARHREALPQSAFPSRYIWLCLQRNYGHTKKHIVKDDGLLQASCPSARHREALPQVHYLSKSVPIGVRFYSVKAQPDWNAFFVLPRATLFAKPHEKICVLPVFRNNLALGGMLRMLTIKTVLKINRCKRIRRHPDCAVQMIFVLKNTNGMV